MSNADRSAEVHFMFSEAGEDFSPGFLRQIQNTGEQFFTPNTRNVYLHHGLDLKGGTIREIQRRARTIGSFTQAYVDVVPEDDSAVEEFRVLDRIGGPDYISLNVGPSFIKNDFNPSSLSYFQDPGFGMISGIYFANDLMTKDPTAFLPLFANLYKGVLVRTSENTKRQITSYRARFLQVLNTGSGFTRILVPVEESTDPIVEQLNQGGRVNIETEYEYLDQNGEKIMLPWDRVVENIVSWIISSDDLSDQDIVQAVMGERIDQYLGSKRFLTRPTRVALAGKILSSTSSECLNSALLSEFPEEAVEHIVNRAQRPKILNLGLDMWNRLRPHRNQATA